MADGESFDRAPAPRRAGGGGGGASGLMAEIKKVPLWVWPIAAIVVFFVLRAFLGNKGASTAAADTSASSDSDSSSGDADSGDQNGAPVTNPDLNPTSGGIQQPVTPPPAKPPVPISPKGKPMPAQKVPPGRPHGKGIHVVQSGETLNEIAQRYGVSEEELYTSNAGVIESTAKAHGHASSNGGWWIFPGMKLSIP